MSGNVDDAGNAPRKKSSGIRDLSTDALTDEEAGTVKGGATIVPCVKPPIRPNIDPCWRPIGSTNPSSGR